MLQSDGLKTEDERNKDFKNESENNDIRHSTSDLLISTVKKDDPKDSKTSCLVTPESVNHCSDENWPCPRCTYLNYSKALRCSMCTEPCPSARKKTLVDVGENDDEVVVEKRQQCLVESSRSGSDQVPSTSNLHYVSESYETEVTNSPPDSSADFNSSNNSIGGSLSKSIQSGVKDNLNIENPENVPLSFNTKGSDVNELTLHSAAPHIILDSSQKWSCPRCTYYNWPRSKVCVVCRAAPNGGGTRTSEEEVFIRPKLPESLSSDEGSGTSSVSSIDYKSSNRNQIKWQCGSCTHENLASSSKCSVCNKNQSLNSLNEETHILPQTKDCQKISPPVTLNRKSTTKLNSRNREAVFTNEDRMKRLNIRKKSPLYSINCDSKRKNYLLSEHQQKSIALSQSDEQKYFQSNNRFAMSKLDWMYLQACWAVSIGAVEPVELYIIAGGDKKRALTSYEAIILDIPGVFPGCTLMMVAILFKRTRIIELLMSHEKISSFTCPTKHPACGVSVDLTNQIMRTISNSLRYKNGPLKCQVFQDNVQTYVLPAEIHKFPKLVQKQLMSEIIDQSVKRELESENRVVNWNREVTLKLKSKLRPLWNRTAGDCLLDAVLQATWGVFDTQNILRKALADTLQGVTVSSPSSSQTGSVNTNASSHSSAVTAMVASADVGGRETATGDPIDAAFVDNSNHSSSSNRALFVRWKEQEVRNASEAGFSLDNKQLEEEWATLTRIAAQPGQPLEQLHIFVLAHILRRPIIVYGVKVVKSFRGEEISPAKFEGVYLPVLWEPAFCNRNPICLGYTPGHFSALVTLESPMVFDPPQSHVFSGDHFEGGPEAPVVQQRHHQGGYANCHANCNHVAPAQPQKFESPNYYLPLIDCDFRQLPVHFLLNCEAGQEDILLNQMLDCIVTPGGILVARFLANSSSNSNCSNINNSNDSSFGGGVVTTTTAATCYCPPSPLLTSSPCQHPLVNHMNDLWLERYRILSSTMNQSEDEEGAGEECEEEGNREAGDEKHHNEQQQRPPRNKRRQQQQPPHNNNYQRTNRRAGVLSTTIQ